MAVNRVTLTINSRQYTVVANENAEYIERLGNYINEKVETVRMSGQNVLGERPVVLAALNICDEYFKCIEGEDLIKEQMQQCTDKNTKLQQVIRRLRDELENANSDQISIEETALKAEVKNAKDELTEANNKIRFLEGHVKSMENKIKELDEQYKQRENEFLEMIDKD